MGKLRNIHFKTLLRTDRAVRIVSRKNFGRDEEYVYVVAQMAGDQNPDGSNRLVSVGFKDGPSAKDSGGQLLEALRNGVVEGWISTCEQYNYVIERWAGAGQKEIERKNRELLRDAEAAAKVAPDEDVLIDLRGMTLKDYVIAGLQEAGLWHKPE